MADPQWLFRFAGIACGNGRWPLWHHLFKNCSLGTRLAVAAVGHYYGLEAELLDGRRVKLLLPVPEVDDAQYVFTALRRWLEAAGGLK